MQSAKRHRLIAAVLQARHHRDYLAGALLLATGTFAILNARTYGVGSVRDMGPGFFPLAIGVMLAAIGVLMLVVAYSAQRITRGRESESRRRDEVTPFVPPSGKPEWRGWLCIIASLILFILVAHHGGLVPAIFLSVLVAALGDKQNSLRAATVLALSVTVVGVIVFYWALSIQLPLFSWGGN